MQKFKYIGLILLFSFSSLTSQVFTDADPFYLLEKEKKSFILNQDDTQNLLFRPFLNKIDDTKYGYWELGFRTEFFANSNAPNLENTSDRWIGKGVSFFQGLQFAYSNKFLVLSFEPFYFSNQNKNYTQDWEEYFHSLTTELQPDRFDQPYREDKFSRLNDNRPHGSNRYAKTGIRNAQIYLHYNGLGIGYSNANMWWGSGLHTSLNMTNNTTGFPHLKLGTIKEQRYKNIGLNFWYAFADSLKHNTAKPFFTAINSSITYYSEPTITLGFSRTYLTGGTRTNEKITRGQAMKIPFETLFLEGKNVDIWDQTLVGYLTLTIPKSGFMMFIEYGRNDHAWDSDDFLRQPDHSGASVIGFRKYGFFGNPKLVGGLEYANLSASKYWNDRQSSDWYNRWNFDNWSYDGRHWGAHSGPDSDDFYIFFGYLGDKLSIIPAFNYERHGVIDNKIPEKEYDYNPEEFPWLHIWGNRNFWPEVKLEYRLDVRYNYKNFLFNIYYEYENIHNDQFREWAHPAFANRKTHVFWFGIERRFDKKEISKLVKRYLTKN